MKQTLLVALVTFSLGMGAGLLIADTPQYRVWRWGKESVQQLKSCKELLHDWFPR